jgi:hypothetical protein
MLLHLPGPDARPNPADKAHRFSLIRFHMHMTKPV